MGGCQQYALFVNIMFSTEELCRTIKIGYIPVKLKIYKISKLKSDLVKLVT